MDSMLHFLLTSLITTATAMLPYMYRYPGPNDFHHVNPYSQMFGFPGQGYMQPPLGMVGQGMFPYPMFGFPNQVPPIQDRWKSLFCGGVCTPDDNSCPNCMCNCVCPFPACNPSCHIDYSNMCPRCVCSTNHISTEICPNIKCGGFCEVVTSVDECPECQCDDDCNVPTCPNDCEIDFSGASSKCPHCSCSDETTTTEPASEIESGMCSHTTCGGLCNEVVHSDHHHCVVCECDPSCNIPKCEPPCILDFSGKFSQCPICICDHHDEKNLHHPTYPVCEKVTCDHTCKVTIGADGCPFCECRHKCTIRKCQPKCELVYDGVNNPCPYCVCKADLKVPKIAIGHVGRGSCVPIKCSKSCKSVRGMDGCHVCKCDQLCLVPECPTWCSLDSHSGQCPQCICDGRSHKETTHKESKTPTPKKHEEKTTLSQELGDNDCKPVECGGFCKEEIGLDGCVHCTCGPCQIPLCPNCDIDYSGTHSDCPICPCPDEKVTDDIHSSPRAHEWTYASDPQMPKMWQRRPKYADNYWAAPSEDARIVHNDLEHEACKPVSCGGLCKQQTSINGCPFCECEPACPTLRCIAHCYLDYSGIMSSCPRCECRRHPRLSYVFETEYFNTPLVNSVTCNPVWCGGLCRPEMGSDGCEFCQCDISCTIPNCPLGCEIDYSGSLSPCPRCACGTKMERETENVEENMIDLLHRIGVVEKTSRL